MGWFSGYNWLKYHCDHCQIPLKANHKTWLSFLSGLCLVILITVGSLVFGLHQVVSQAINQMLGNTTGFVLTDKGVLLFVFFPLLIPFFICAYYFIGGYKIAEKKQS